MERIGASSFDVIMLIKEIYSLMNTQIGCSMKESGLTPQQTMVIKILAHNKEVTMSQLCEELSLAKATVSGIVQRLEESGYVVKFKKEDDKRNTYVTFSDQGKVFSTQFRNTMNHSFTDIFKNFTQEELNQIKSSLVLLVEKMKAEDS